MIPQYIQFHASEREGFFIDSRTGDLYRLNETGALIMELNLRGVLPDEIAEKITQQYDISLVAAKSDVSKFFTNLNDPAKTA